MQIVDVEVCYNKIILLDHLQGLVYFSYDYSDDAPTNVRKIGLNMPTYAMTSLFVGEQLYLLIASSS